MKILEVIQQAKEKGYTHVSAHGDAMLETVAEFEECVIKKIKFYAPLYNLTYNNIQDDASGVRVYGRVYSVGADYPSMIFEKKKG